MKWIFEKLGGVSRLVFVALGAVLSVFSATSLAQNNASFETPALGAGFQYNPGGASWSFSGGAGIAGNTSGFTNSNPAAPNGTQVAFLQGANSAVTQNVSMNAGAYKISFAAAQRPCCGGGNQTVKVLLDNAEVGRYTPTSTSYATYSTSSFTVSSSGNHSLSIAGVGCSGDCTAFVDSVGITVVSTSQAPSCSSVAMQSSTTSAITGTLRTYAYGVQNATTVQFPTWGETGGQDDIIWYNGTNAGGGTWYADIDLSRHKTGNPEYGTFHTHVYVQSASTAVFCGASDWTRTAPTAATGLTAVGCPSYQYATDANVFNWRFYLNNNADLILAGIYTPQGACTHWLSSGINEGRQAHPGFSAPQYLGNYGDLRSAFGASNYRSAIQHWITSGINESRIGYQENLTNGYGVSRATVQNIYNGNKIFVSASGRTAGAIDSLMFNNIEFINSWDHGRQLQVALAKPQFGEGYNPTEAGSCADGVGYGTSSVINSVSATGSFMSITNTPAFWHTPNFPACGVANNTTTVASNYKFTKNVTVGIAGLPNVIEFATSVTIGEPIIPYNGTAFNIEAPTAYLGGEYSTITGFNPQTGAITNYSNCGNNGCGNVNTPSLIYSNADSSYATGVCRANTATAAKVFGIFSFVNSANPLDSTTKWSASFALPNTVTSGTTYSFKAYIVVAKSSNTQSAVGIAESTLAQLFNIGLCQP